MTLDLVRINSQIREMESELDSDRAERSRRLDLARGTFRKLAPQWQQLATSARSSDRSAAAPLDPLDHAVDAPNGSPDYEVLATDGSTIEPDRHGPAMCAVINIGRVRISYGSHPDATLESEPKLIFRPEELYIEQSGRRLLLRERLLDARRSLLEMKALAEMAQDTGSGSPQVALADGLLTIWRDDWATPDGEKVISEFNDALLTVARAGLPLAAYISSPNSHWVVDLLRNAIACGDRCQGGCEEGDCVFKGQVDVILFDQLKSGQRSGRFEVVGKDQTHYDADVRSHFFYLRTDREVVRVEIPAWIARDEEALDRVHYVVLDQVQRGQGYPAALARAHERAVLSGRDRMVFQQLVVESLARAGLDADVSEKQASKNRRAV